jgi:DNA polymerase I-like protein with 3'-5' exonuclease and polymerase domains
MKFTARCPTGSGSLAYTLEYVTTPAQVGPMVDWLTQQKVLGLDTETSGLFWHQDRIATIQIGTPEGPDPRVYVIDVRCFAPDALEPLFAILRNPKIVKLGMNLSFECGFLQAGYGVKVRRCADIQVAELVMRAGLWPDKKTRDADDEGANRKAYGETSMAKLCQRYLGITIEKDRELRTGFYTTAPGRHSRRQLEYAAGDVIYPFLVYAKQLPELQARQLVDTLRIEFRLLPILVEATLRGLHIDRDQWMALWQEAVVRRTEVQHQLDALLRPLLAQQELFDDPALIERLRPVYPKTSKDLSYDSPEQVKWLLKEYCARTGWPVEVVTDLPRLRQLKKHYGQDWLQRRRQTEPAADVDDIPEYLIPEDKHLILLSTRVDVLRLARARRQLPRDIVTLLVEYSKYAQRVDAFGIEFLNKNLHDDGRVHPVFHQVLTATGRLSATPNTQQIPRDPRYRRCFRPRPGYKFVLADYSQIEPRLSAQVSQDPVYLRAFQSGADIYVRVGEGTLGRTIDLATPEGALLRQIFKVIVLALAYRMGPGKLRNQLTLALEDEILAGRMEPPTFQYASELHRRFFEVHRGIATYQEEVGTQADPAKTPRPKLWDEYLQAPVTWVEAPCGRKRFFPPDAANTYTEGPNSPIQGASASITKAAAVLVQDHIDAHGIDATVVNLVHDEIVWEVREDQAEAFAPEAKRLMEVAGAYWITDVPVIAEFPKGTTGVCDAWIKEAA